MMKVFEGKFIPEDDYTANMRALKVDEGYLSVPLSKAKSIRTMAYSLKKEEGIVLKTKKVGDEVFIWRVE